MTIGSICTRQVDVAHLDETVRSAAQRMHARKVGCLVVVDAERCPLGLVTDRDLTIRVLAPSLDPVLTIVRDVMTPFPKRVHEDTSLDEVLRIRRTARCRRSPVIDRKQTLEGIISLDDILRTLADELHEIRDLIDEESPESLAAV